MLRQMHPESPDDRVDLGAVLRDHGTVCARSSMGDLRSKALLGRLDDALDDGPEVLHVAGLRPGRRPQSEALLRNSLADEPPHRYRLRLGLRPSCFFAGTGGGATAFGCPGGAASVLGAPAADPGKGSGTAGDWGSPCCAAEMSAGSSGSFSCGS